MNEIGIALAVINLVMCSYNFFTTKNSESKKAWFSSLCGWSAALIWILIAIR